MSIQKRVAIAIIDPSSRISAMLSETEESLEIHHVPVGSAMMRELYLIQPKLVVLANSLDAGRVIELCRMIRTDPRLPLTRVLAIADSNWSSAGKETIASLAHAVVPQFNSVQQLIEQFHLSLAQSRPGKGRDLDSGIEVIRVGRLTIVSDSYSVSIGANDIRLTAGEFELLWALARNSGRALTMDQLAQIGDPTRNTPSDRTIRARIAALRRKLGPDARQIENVRGVGYRLNA